MGRLVVLMVTAFVDMMGNLIVFPLVPFYAKRLIGHGPLWTALDAVGLGGEGAVVSLMVMMFAVAQLVSAPSWGRVGGGSRSVSASRSSRRDCFRPDRATSKR